MFFNPIYSCRDIVLKKPNSTAKFTDTVKVSDQGVVWIYDSLVLILQRVRVASLQKDGIGSQKGGLHRLARCADSNIFAERFFFNGYLAYKEAVSDLKTIWWKLHRFFSGIQALYLVISILDCCSGNHILRLDIIMCTHVLDNSFICTVDRSEWAGNQVKLILDNQFRREERFHFFHSYSRETVCLVMTFGMFCSDCNVSITFTLTVNSSKQSICVDVPRQPCEFVYR